VAFNLDSAVPNLDAKLSISTFEDKRSYFNFLFSFTSIGYLACFLSSVVIILSNLSFAKLVVPMIININKI